MTRFAIDRLLMRSALVLACCAVTEGASAKSYLPSTDKDILACVSGEVEACQSVHKRLDGQCQNPAMSNQNNGLCMGQLIGADQVIESLKRAHQVCNGDEGSQECALVKRNATDAARRLAFRSGIVSGEEKDSAPLSERVDDRLFNKNAPNGPIAVIFTFPESKVGDCTTLSGARLELTSSQNGYALHYIAQMHTSFSVWGDVWHVSWRFLDSSHNEILRSQQADLPEGTRMHPQFGNSNIDYHGTIEPEAPARVQQVLHSIAGVISDNQC